MKERYGFFGGSFNPVTKAHINLANIVVEKFKLDKLIFVPMGNKYKKKDLIDEKYRYEMLKIATSNYKNLEVSDMELNLNHSLTILQAFKNIEEQYKEVIPYFIIGSDNLEKLVNSPDFEILAKNYQYIILQRGIQVKDEIALNLILKRFKTHFNILKENPYEQISSTNLRKFIKNNKTKEIGDIISDDIYRYIKDNKLYT